MITKSVAITLTIIGIIVLVDALSTAQPPDPNTPINKDVRKIIMPSGTKLPPSPIQYVCPKHGKIGDALLTIDVDGVMNRYCKKCAMQFVCALLELNTPKLKVVPAEGYELGPKVGEFYDKVKDPNE